MSTPVLFSFGFYLAVLLVICVWGWYRTANLSDYLLGGRGLGRWVTALAACATDMSGWLMMGLPGLAYVAGLGAGWMALGLLVGTWLNWRVVAEPLRRRTEALDDALTVPAYFARRFPEYGTALKVVAAVTILGFFTFYTSSGLVAAGKLFETVFEFPYFWAVTLGTVLIMLYTLFGGFLAISWADLFQGLLMLLALVVIALVGWMRLDGGMGALMDSSPQLFDPFTMSGTDAVSLIAVLSLLGWGLGYFGQPHIIIRFMAIRDPSAMTDARRIAVTWTAVCLAAAIMIGIVGSALVPGLGGGDTEKVFMLLAELIFHPVVAGILLAAILAAIMSTAEAQLLVASSALTEDLATHLGGAAADGHAKLWLGRSGVLVIALVAWLLALEPDSKVLDLVAYAWAGFGAAFGPAIILSLYWKGMTARGALAGMVTGGLTVVIWSRLSGGLFDLYELVPGFVFAWVAIWAVSSMQPSRPSRS
jgi:sodium/proline symporter